MEYLTEKQVKKAIKPYLKAVEKEMGDIREAAVRAMAAITKGNGSISSFVTFSRLTDISRGMLHRYERGDNLPTYYNATKILLICEKIASMKESLFHVVTCLSKLESKEVRDEYINNKICGFYGSIQRGFLSIEKIVAMLLKHELRSLADKLEEK